jgi:tetratricopeptide (TPR) repeat protein
MSIQSGVTAFELFSTIFQSSINVDSVVTAAMSRGIELYQKEDYAGSITEFKRVAALAPNSDNAVKAYNFSGSAYLRLDRTDDAINAYKSAIRLSPYDDTLHVTLGNVYFDQKRYAEAETEYQTSVRLNSQSATNWYSLGQAYLATEKYDDAEQAFTKITQLSPLSHSGHYGLGQVAYKRGDYDQAIKEFRNVLELKRDFTYAHVDLGYAYADKGDFDNAKQQIKILNNSDTSQADLLSEYVYKVSPPELLAAYTTGGFDVSLGPGTAVSELDASLAVAGSSKYFTMNFIFSKDMDTASVRNPYNWQLGRAAYGAPGGAYNWGLATPSTDTPVLLYPASVLYDPDTLTAEVTFRVNQNTSANGTIDPSHIIFKFTGEDVYGNAMNPAADEYGGFSKIV